jgi:Arc/MetJ-type ribon-helix-helix transcriptional regulator
MAIYGVRRHLVTFRLSEEEYKALRGVCESEAYRSVSDFAREAVMQRVLSHRTRNLLLSQDLRSLGTKLEDLDDGLKDLRSRIARVLGVSNGHGTGPEMNEG